MQGWLNVQKFKQGERVRITGPGAETYRGGKGVVSSINRSVASTVTMWNSRTATLRRSLALSYVMMTHPVVIRHARDHIRTSLTFLLRAKKRARTSRHCVICVADSQNQFGSGRSAWSMMRISIVAFSG
jgi:hypothetical protein